VAVFDLSAVQAVGLDETASKRGQRYVAVFIDMDSRDKLVLFVTPGNGKATLGAFRAFLESHIGHPEHILEVVCDMYGAFLSAVPKHLPNAQITVDWFHIVQTFTRALDEAHKTDVARQPAFELRRHPVLRTGVADFLSSPCIVRL
jgi:transposase